MSQNATQTNTKKLQDLAVQTLDELVSAEGIYASSDAGWSGPFHAWFGRDSAITAGLIFEAEKKLPSRFGKRAYQALLVLRKWQGKKDDHKIGEELGKIAHEINPNTSHNDKTNERILQFQKLWYEDPVDHLLKNWDSVDATPLWVIMVARWHEAQNVSYDETLLRDMRLALEWCLFNMRTYAGWAAFVATDDLPGRDINGYRNLNWKDQYDTYVYADGTLSTQPTKDVFVNGLFWAAMQYGADIFKDRDAAFAQNLRDHADVLKQRFNDPEEGFVFRDAETGLYYFAEALDGKNERLEAIAADAAMCLWAYHGDECIIDARYIDDVVKRIMKPDMLNMEAGMRNYASSTAPAPGGTTYHRGPEVYWPFVSGVVMAGLTHFGYHDEAAQVAKAMLAGVTKFGTCIELFLQTAPGRYEPWHHPTEPQQSAVDQAWTAAGMYYALSILS